MDFKAKIGPLPAWAWGLIVGALFVVWMWVSQRNSSSEVEVTESAPSDADYGGSVVEGSYGSDFSTVPVVPSGGAGEVASETNADWLRKAIAAVVDQGTVSTLSAQTALQKYLAGQKLSAGETSIVNAATAKVGIPPEGVDTPDTSTAKPVGSKYETVTSISAPSPMNAGTSYVIKANVAWKNPQGQPNPPRGTVVFEADGKRIGSTYAYNGVASHTVHPSGKQSSADGILVFRARFVTSDNRKTLGSVSNPVTVRVKK